MILMELTYMLLKVEIPTETLTTYGTLEGFLFIVSVHMKSEIVDLMECLVANMTFISLFTRMS